MAAGRYYQYSQLGRQLNQHRLSHLIFADDTVLVAMYPEDLERMLTLMQLASKPAGLSMHLSKTNEHAITSTIAVDGNIIEHVDRYVYLGKTVTQAGNLLPVIKSRVSLEGRKEGRNSLFWQHIHNIMLYTME